MQHVIIEQPQMPVASDGPKLLPWAAQIHRCLWLAARKELAFGGKSNGGLGGKLPL